MGKKGLEKQKKVVPRAGSLQSLLQSSALPTELSREHGIVRKNVHNESFKNMEEKKKEEKV